jgi:hypothetical protein
MRAFALVLMLTMTVSFIAPLPAATKTVGDQPCCCAAACHCPISNPCSPACREAQAPSSDKQSPVRPAGVPAVRLFVVSDAFPTTLPFLLPAGFDRCELNASPPLGGNPQQAVLRLWRI